MSQPINPARYEGAIALGKPTAYLMGGLAAWPLLTRMIGMVGIHSRGLYSVLGGIESLIQLVATILFFVWFFKFYKAVGEEYGPTRFTPGFAIGCWFIPFANFVLPFMTVSDAWQRTLGQDRAWVVPLWWWSWIGSAVLTMVTSVLIALHIYLGFGNMIIGYLVLALHLTAFGCWMLLIQWAGEWMSRPPAQTAGAIAR